MGKTSAVKKLAWKAPVVDRDASPYSAFDALDGSHPWKEWVPEGFINYSARQVHMGDVAYFNFELAKEMGLIPKNHAHRMTKTLRQKIIKTFSLRIINEYDQIHNVSFPKQDIKPGQFMATRYLQLQHSNKKGATSGDGRCIWNGIVSHNGKTWDVSSRGTGVTALAPGAVEAGRPLRSGNTQFGYGCGLAEIDELYASAIMAEVFHNKGINTERVLAIIDFGDGYGIGVRAALNLIRPAHLFMYLKQGQLEPLQRATDYLILRQQKNGEWKFGLNNENRYDLMLEELCSSFARFVAQLEREYIFAWLDWDGDNVLANAGIIDYGSVRQFGLRHDEYRYDDVERWSTNLTEQKSKAKETLKVFSQLVDFLKTGKKKALNHFDHHPILRRFDKHFDHYLLEHFLYQIGLSSNDRQLLLQKNFPLVNSLYSEFSALEKVKTWRKAHEVADGINRPAIYNMRNILRELPQHLCSGETPWELNEMDTRTFFEHMLSENARGKDAQLTSTLRRRISKLQNLYKRVFAVLQDERGKNPLLQVSQRAAIINRPDRMTGNALLFIVSEILKHRRQGLPYVELQKIIDQIIADQSERPEHKDSQPHGTGTALTERRAQQLFNAALKLVVGYREDI